MCDLIEYHENGFKIKYGNYQSDHYSDLNELRLYDVSIIQQDSKYKSIPFDIYVFVNFKSNSKKSIISRKLIDFKIDQQTYNVGEFWIIRIGDRIALKWAVFDYQISYMFIDDIMNCPITDVIGVINNVVWKDFAYDNFVIPWVINNLDEYCRKNIKLPLLDLHPEIISLIWDYIICPFDKIEF